MFIFKNIEQGLKTASSSRTLVRHCDWHNQVTAELKGKGHQQELTSPCY